MSRRPNNQDLMNAIDRMVSNDQVRQSQLPSGSQQRSPSGAAGLVILVIIVCIVLSVFK